MPDAAPSPRKLSPAMLIGLAVALVAIGLAWSGGCVGGDAWSRMQVCSFVNESADEVRVLACYFGEERWAPVFHGPTHWLAPERRMQAADADPDAAWLPAGFQSVSDLYRPEAVAGVSYRVQRRASTGGVAPGRALPDVDVVFLPGRHTQLKLTGEGELVVLDGALLGGLGLRPETRWTEPAPASGRARVRDPAELPAAPGE